VALFENKQSKLSASAKIVFPPLGIGGDTPVISGNKPGGEGVGVQRKGEQNKLKAAIYLTDYEQF
jgi:hypothetical protein